MKLEKKNSNIKIGYTQEDVAEMLDLAPRYVSDIERNKTKGSIDTLVKLCNIYHITPTYILQDYLDLKDEFRIDPDLVGYYELSKRDKEIISELIKHMNTKK